ncbi:Angiogenin-2 like [Heracleum sosnowskyi]|uniref:Angiogenin-2 like n=1 Tax=Heracleum sosnowskyi TaxID=360622 RepID=A0AAD8JNA9_9APIA|nr:Angiogenin-2 like [Heracleum sosnowskyi]
MSTSECSSGCESGWTAYLDQSSNSTFDMYKKSERSKRVTSQDEDEDLSMVSDASSGPRHDNYYEEKDNCLRNYSYSASKQGKVKKHDTKIQENKGKLIEDCCLDDTASSLVLSFSKKNLALSTNQASLEQETQGFSTTHYKGKSSLNQNLGFRKSSVTGVNKSGDFQARNYKWQ